MDAIRSILGLEAGDADWLALLRVGELVAGCEAVAACRVRAEGELGELRVATGELLRERMVADGFGEDVVAAAVRGYVQEPVAVLQVVYGVGDIVAGANPYGCNQYGEGWAEEHNGNSTKYEVTGFSGKKSKMLINKQGGNTVEVATKEKKVGKDAYPDASERGLKKAAEGGKKVSRDDEEEGGKKEVNPIGKAKTKEEAIEHTKSILGEGCKVSFNDNIKVEQINEFNETVQKLVEKYGKFGLKQMGSALMDDTTGAWANEILIEINHNHGHAGIHNLKSWKPYEEPTAEGFTRHNVGATENGISIEDIITHEFGHVIQARLSHTYEKYLEHKKYMGEQWTKAAYGQKGLLEGIALMAEWRKVLGRARRSKDITKISKYANKNDREFFSECFAMRERGDKIPEYISLAMDKIISYKQREYEKKAA